jgi:hypothetical protein
VKTIVAWEWKTTTDVVESWTFGAFLDNLRWVSQRRYGSAVRKSKRQEDAGVERLKQQLG